MRTLLLLRHAKSSWTTGAADHDRPLNGRGRKQAAWMGEELRRRELVPGLSWVSSAARTRETCRRMALEVAVHVDERLYLADPDTLYAVLAETPADVDTVLALGHNPGWEDAASDLSGLTVRMTTANLIVLHAEAPDWSDVAAHRWQLDAHIQSPFHG